MEQNTKKILITTGIIGVLSLVAYKLLAKGRTSSNLNLGVQETNLNEAPPIEDVTIYTDAEIAAKKAAQEVETKEPTKYTSIELADMLQQDFNGNGTNWSAGQHGGVVGVLLQLNTNEDFDNLDKAYGIRTIKAGVLKSLFQKPYVGNMNGAFNSELTKKEIEAVNEILSKKGITRRITIENTNK